MEIIQYLCGNIPGVISSNIVLQEDKSAQTWHGIEEWDYLIIWWQWTRIFFNIGVIAKKVGEGLIIYKMQTVNDIGIYVCVYRHRYIYVYIYRCIYIYPLLTIFNIWYFNTIFYWNNSSNFDPFLPK